jgi:site-specific recombinase XerD
LRAGEVVRLKVKRIESAQRMIRVEQSKSRKDRNVMLSPDTSTYYANGGRRVRPLYAALSSMPVQPQVQVRLKGGRRQQYRAVARLARHGR